MRGSASQEGNLPPPPTPWRWLVLAGVLAAMLHLGVHLTSPASAERFEKYDQAAISSVAGGLDPERYTDFSPLYLELHELAVRLSGPERAGDLVRGLQILSVGAAATLFLWLLHQRGFPRWVRVVAFAALVLDTSWLIYSPLGEPEALLVFLLIAILACFHRLTHEERSRDWLWALLFGLLCSLATLARPTLLPAAVLGALALMLVPGPGGDRRRRSLLALVVMLPLVATQLGLALRNQAHFGELSPRVMNPGTVFFEGNNPVSWGESGTYPPATQRIEPSQYGGEVDFPHVAYRELARASSFDDDQRPRSIADVNAFWIGRSLHFLGEHPQHLRRLLAVKTDAILRGPIDHDLTPAWKKEEQLPALLPRFPYALLSLSALLGALLLLLELRRRPAALLELGLVASQFLAMLAFYVSARQRLTALPVVILVAAALWQSLDRQRQTGRRGLLLAVLTVVLLLSLALPLSFRTEHGMARQRLVLEREQAIGLVQAAEAAVGNRQPESARELLARAASLRPELLPRMRPAGLGFEDEGRGLARRALVLRDEDEAAATGSASESADPARQFERALLLTQAGRLDDAAAAWQELSVLEPPRIYGHVVSASPRVHLADLELRRGRKAEAQALLRRELEAWPAEPFALARLAALGDGAAEEDLERYYDAVSVALLIGEARCVIGRDTAVAERLREATVAMPRLRYAWILLAACVEPDLEKARADYLQALRLAPAPVQFEPEIRRLFAATASEGPEDPRRALERVSVLRQLGAIDEALAALPPRDEVPPELEGLWQFEHERLLELSR